jgi:hypothetical protein
LTPPDGRELQLLSLRTRPELHQRLVFWNTRSQLTISQQGLPKLCGSFMSEMHPCAVPILFLHLSCINHHANVWVVRVHSLFIRSLLHIIQVNNTSSHSLTDLVFLQSLFIHCTRHSFPTRFDRSAPSYSRGRESLPTIIVIIDGRRPSLNQAHHHAILPLPPSLYCPRVVPPLRIGSSSPRTPPTRQRQCVPIAVFNQHSIFDTFCNGLVVDQV